MDKTWRTITAGILDIVSGVWVLFAGFLAGPGWRHYQRGRQCPCVGARYCFSVWPFRLLSLAFLAVIGGIFAIQRKAWGWPWPDRSQHSFAASLWYRVDHIDCLYITNSSNRAYRPCKGVGIPIRIILDYTGGVLD